MTRTLTITNGHDKHILLRKARLGWSWKLDARPGGFPVREGGWRPTRGWAEHAAESHYRRAVAWI